MGSPCDAWAMTDPTPTEATPAMRRKADLMVGLFVGAVVAILGGNVLLFTDAPRVMCFGLIIVGVLAAFAGVSILRSISPEERALLTSPKPDPGPEADAENG